MPPITFADVLAAEERLRPFLPPTPLTAYPLLDEAAGAGIRVLVKHENHTPVGTFKLRNALAVLTALPPAGRRRGVVAASRGNHGLGLAWGGRRLGVPVTVCVPLGNNPEKNAAMRALGARLVEEGRDYDEAVAVADRLAAGEGLRLVHSTNDPLVLAGAATVALEMLRAAPDLDAIVAAVGGGSQAVGALVVAPACAPELKVYGVQAAGASAAHDSWHARRRLARDSAATIADGIATRTTYDLTFPALQEGLAGFVTVTDAEIGAAIRLLLRATHNLAEGAGAAGLAGVLALRGALAGKRVGIILSGGNIDRATLRQVLAEPA